MERFFAKLTAIAVSFLCHGYAMKHLWRWFVTPLGVPELGFAHALGLAMFIAWLATSDADLQYLLDTSAERGKTYWERYTQKLIYTLCIWGLGYTWHLMM